MRLSAVAVAAKADTRRTAHGTKNPVNESEMRPLSPSNEYLSSV